MREVFKLRLDEIQPSQLYISRPRLDTLLKRIKTGNTSSIEPIPIKELDGELVSTDGHTRGVAWHLCGYAEVEVEWEDLEMDWEAYTICVQWCKDEGIHSIIDLKYRIINSHDYQKLWLDRCRIMQEELEEKRASEAH